jgi:Pentapeptide repeats (9 copies)
MELQPYNFDDCKNQIMSEKEEISGELLLKTHFVVDTSGSQLEIYKTDINKYKSQIETFKTDIDKYKSQIDEYKDELNKKSRVANAAVITASGAFITAIASIIVALISTVWKTEVDYYIVKEKRFLVAIEDLKSKKGSELIQAIGIIDTYKDEVFMKNPKLQWKTVEAIVKTIQDNLAIKNKSESDLSKRKYGSFSQKNTQKLIDIMKFETENNVNFDIKGRPVGKAGIIDLSGVFLYDIDLSEAKLPRTNFNGSILDHATITHANLKESLFIGTQLRNAKMQRSNLSGSFLSDDFSRVSTNLIGVKLDGTNLRSVNLKGAKLFDPEVKGSKSFAMEKIQKACNFALAEFDTKYIIPLGLRNMPTTPDVGKTCEKSIK